MSATNSGARPTTTSPSWRSQRLAPAKVPRKTVLILLATAATALLARGMLFVNSGYLFNPHMPGTILLAFKIEPRGPTGSPTGTQPKETP